MSEDVYRRSGVRLGDSKPLAALLGFEYLGLVRILKRGQVTSVVLDLALISLKLKV